MNKNKTIEFLNENHQKMEFIVNSLHKEEMLQHQIVKAWNIKDILAHLTAWNFEIGKSIDVVLKNEDLWFRTKNEEEFNKIQVNSRKSYTLQEVIDEWKSSFNKLIKKLESFTCQKWEHDSGFTWKDGSKITVESLFEYRYRGLGHEGGHAVQIEEYFGRDRHSR